MAFAREEAFRLLEKALAEGRLGHAYLISGSPGSGVQEFASPRRSVSWNPRFIARRRRGVARWG